MPHNHTPRLAPELVKACSARRKRLAESLGVLKIDALLVSCEKDIQYLTGFVGHDSLLLVTASPSQAPEDAIIVSDPRYDEFLDPWRQSGGVSIVMGIRHRLADSIRQICDRRSFNRLGIQADHVTIAGRGKLAATLGESRIVETVGLVSSLRQRKDELEVATIERAIAVQQDALAATLPQITLGMTELQFSATLEYEMKMRGSQGAGFTPIIGAGADSSIIHHATTHTPIETGTLLVDWGAMIDGYNGDLTRTFAIGQWHPKIREIYPIVLEAQHAAIEAIAPGKICAEIDAVARKVIAKAGFGEYFGHGLGHSLGMDVHESPYFNDLETAVKLEPGMIMTVEPGIYLPGVGGVRIEDDVLITDRGCRVLSNFPKDLDSMTLDVGATKSKAQTTKLQRERIGGHA